MKRIKLEIPRNCSQLYFNSLPNDVLLEIFQYLDEDSIRAALNVCQSWSLIIRSSPSLAKRLAIKVQGSFKNDQSVLLITVPVENLLYRRLHLVGHVHSKFNNSDLLQTYGQSIQHLILEDFSGNEVLLNKCQNVTKLKIVGSCEVHPSLGFKNLTHLNLRINCLDGIGWLQHSKLQLKTFKLNLKQSANLNENGQQMIHNFILQQRNYLRQLSVVGVPLDSQFIKDLLRCDKLTQIELEIDVLEVNRKIICGQKWRTLKFVNPRISHKSFIFDVFRAVSSIQNCSVIYTDSGSSLPSSTSIFDEIPNFKSGFFSLSTSKDSLNHFTQLQELSIKRIDSESQLKKLTTFLKNCPNLKLLHLNLISNRAKLDQNLFKILNSCENLEQLQIEAYSDKLDISSATFDAIKSLHPSLKRLTIKIAPQQVQDMKLKAGRLIDTKVQTIVMQKQVHRTRLESHKRNSDECLGLCILIKKYL